MGAASVTSGRREWLRKAVSDFGEACRAQLSGPGWTEWAIRPPIVKLLQAVGSHHKLQGILWHEETPLPEFGVRPDFAVEVDGAIIGYIEVKRPEEKVDPKRFTGRNKEQWDRLRDLPNLLYTNGTEWRLFRHGEPVGNPVVLEGDLRSAGHRLTAHDLDAFDNLLGIFLHWYPEEIRQVYALVRRIAPLCRLLRAAVLEELGREKQAVADKALTQDLKFTGLKDDWRKLLFPTADDATFADGYAQAVTFALLLARTEGIPIAETPLHEIGRELDVGHALMGKALQLLTDNVSKSFDVTLDLLVRVINAVQWDSIRKGRRDAYLYLYESFLEVYDEELRQKSGSYYTPREVVEEMVRLTEDALRIRLDRPEGYASRDVRIVDPAMGTGTYLHAIIEHVANWANVHKGPGAPPDEIGNLAERLIGFELQMGPFAVAELRTSDLLKRHDAVPPREGMNLYVTDTLDNPYVAEEFLASTYAVISESRKRANKVKAKVPVTVVIGNPPYDDKAKGRGGWIESGAEGKGAPPIKTFKWPLNGRYEHILKNLYIYFWRWATWKVFDAHEDAQDGVICFITPSGFATGPGGRGMRNYLRHTCEEGWIIDLSPEGHRPDIATRIFPGVAQPLAICIFVRRADTNPNQVARIHYRAISGKRDVKYRKLKEIQLDDDEWLDAHAKDIRPFRPASETTWEEYPELRDLFPWVSPGMKANRSWVTDPSKETLERRWSHLLLEANLSRKSSLMKETRDRTLDKVLPPLSGQPKRPTGIDEEPVSSKTTPIRIAMRSFDRQWLIPDRRLIDFPRPDLWDSLQPGQLFLNQQSSHEIKSGPAVVATALLPDTHHFNGRGGQIMPVLHPDGTENVPPRLLTYLADQLNIDQITAHDLAAYTIAIAGHANFTKQFTDQLLTPGVRIPLTRDRQLWLDGVTLGAKLLWVSTYGAFYSAPDRGRPAGNVTYSLGDSRRVMYQQAVGQAVPAEIKYNEMTKTVHLGHGEFGPVPVEVWDYDVGGMQIVKKWFGYRKSQPNRKRTSPLDDLHVDTWPAEWSTELVELLSALRRLIELEPAQQDLLTRITAGQLISTSDLISAGVLPVNDKQRKARRKVEFGEQDQLG
jgi:hypothetical protein